MIGCPKTIDGDMKNDKVETSFGFDTAAKTYSELIGNISRDCNSARKYWHFIKLMGRSASHIALECALQTHPNICLISEEIQQKDLSLNDIVEYIATIVAHRAAQGNNFGVVLVPEGLIEFIPAIGRLIQDLNDLLATNGDEYRDLDEEAQWTYILDHLKGKNRATFATLPKEVALQLSLDRDPHGNVPVSLIETEKLLSDMVGVKLAEWKKEGLFVGKYAAQHHFFGYEGRCAAAFQFRRRLLLCARHKCGDAHRLRQDGLHGAREASHGEVRGLGAGRRASDDDDEHGAQKRKTEPGHPQSARQSQRASVPGFRRKA